MVGDFNVMRILEKRAAFDRFSSAMIEFLDVILELHLIDSPLEGGDILGLIIRTHLLCHGWNFFLLQSIRKNILLVLCRVFY